MIINDTNQDHFIVKPKKNLRQSRSRWVALMLICLINFGNYYSWDNPQALQTSIEQVYKVDAAEYGLLYTVFSLPNIFLPLFGGILIDYIGVRPTIFISSTLVVIGQGIVSLGGQYLNFNVLLLGRIVLGVGSETLTSAQTVISAQWFIGKELAFAMGFTLCVARLGSSLNSVLSPAIYTAFNDMFAPFFTGFLMCILSLISLLPLFKLDRAAEKQDPKKDHISERVNFRDIQKLSRVYFLLMINCFLIYGAFFGFMDNINNMIQKRFGFTQDQAGEMIPIVYLSAAFITPAFGFFIDKYGKRISFMIIASSLFVLTHLYIAFLPDGSTTSPNYWIILGLVGTGLFYSVYASIFWPCVPLIVESKLLGTAYGLIISVESCMIAALPFINGIIHDHTEDYKEGYFWTEILLGILVAIGVGVTIKMYFEDKKNGGVLEKTKST